MSGSEQTEVYAARDEIDATLVKSMLAEAGIKSLIFGGQLQGAIGELPPGLPAAPRVWTSADSADTARQLIREMEQTRRQHREDEAGWSCPNCSEDVTVDFEICWNCQTPRIPDES
ncbi:MAG: DUF2007 domain-containing protein [Planctomycetota bacterium]|nr:DUF2007 domain-containing protein [Planctomycetota bacterium]